MPDLSAIGFRLFSNVSYLWRVQFSSVPSTVDGLLDATEFENVSQQSSSSGPARRFTTASMP